MKLIAEVKTKSPFGYKATKSWDAQFDFAREHGDIISIHTDPRWGGSFDLLAKARRLTDKPILAKGIHQSDDEVMAALRAGADHVLVVGRWPYSWMMVGDSVWLEPLDETPYFTGGTMVINSRNLQTGQRWHMSFGGRLKYVNEDTRIIQASYIRTVDDVSPRAWGVLVGEHLEGFVQSMRRKP